MLKIKHVCLSLTLSVIWHSNHAIHRFFFLSCNQHFSAYKEFITCLSLLLLKMDQQYCCFLKVQSHIKFRCPSSKLPNIRYRFMSILLLQNMSISLRTPNLGIDIPVSDPIYHAVIMR